ncbi:MAG: acyltransferase [Xanthobacteraceae bacterium]|nr:acyltransferase [Xanthobacteraceae bacterium]
MTISVHRFVVLDVMRTIAALAVVTVHTGRIFPGVGASASGMADPQLAVDFFFLLSGFVLANAYEDKFERIGVWDFFKLRLIRLYPLYLFSILISLYGLLKHASHHEPVYFINLGLALVFLPSPFDEAIYPFGAFAWTLLFEMLANLVFAALKKTPAWVLAAIVVVSALLMIVGATTHSLGFIYEGVSGGHTWASFTAGLIRVSFSFFAGALLYRVWLRRRPEYGINPILPLAGLAIALFVKVSPQWRTTADLLTIILVWPALIFAGASYSVKSPRLAKTLAVIGGASYPIYLLHLGVYLKLQKLLDPIGIYGGMIFLVVIFLISVAVDLVYDVPIRRWLSRKFLTQRPAVTSPQG